MTKEELTEAEYEYHLNECKKLSKLSLERPLNELEFMLYKAHAKKIGIEVKS